MAEVNWTKSIRTSVAQHLPPHALDAFTAVKKVSRHMHVVENPDGFSGLEFAIFDGDKQVSLWLFTEMAAWADAHERVVLKTRGKLNL